MLMAARLYLTDRSGKQTGAGISFQGLSAAGAGAGSHFCIRPATTPAALEGFFADA